MKRPSFQFYEAGWAGSRWVALDPAFSWEIPNLPACYVVYLDGTLTYVGQTMRLRSRLVTQHRIGRLRYSEGYLTPWGQPDACVVKARFGTFFGDWAMREARLIARLQPVANVLGASKKLGVG